MAREAKISGEKFYFELKNYIFGRNTSVRQTVLYKTKYTTAYSMVRSQGLDSLRNCS